MDGLLIKNIEKRSFDDTYTDVYKNVTKHFRIFLVLKMRKYLQYIKIRKPLLSSAVNHFAVKKKNFPLYL